jgi:hypothetical protein
MLRFVRRLKIGTLGESLRSILGLSGYRAAGPSLTSSEDFAANSPASQSRSTYSESTLPTYCRPTASTADFFSKEES